MNWDSEEGQKILAVAYALQNNDSRAASGPKDLMEGFVKEKVYRAYDYFKRKWFYAFEPVEDVRKPLKSVRIVSTGRKATDDRTIAEIRKMRLEGHTVREIASALRVGRGTVGKYIK